MKTILKAAAAALALGAVSAPASAVVVISTPCANTDITPTAINCAGFVAGNVVNSGPNEPLMAELLLQLGFTYNGDSNGLEQVDGGSGIVNFATQLIGQTIIGVHFGNGQGSPGGQGSGDDTAFYLFDAGAGLDTFSLNFSSASTVTLFQTGSPVPEPATWAMMLFGFGAVGFALRRRRRTGITQLA